MPDPMHQEHCSHKLLLMLHVVLMHLELKSSIPALLLIALTTFFPLCLFLFLLQAFMDILLFVYHRHDLVKTWLVIITTTALPIPTIVIGVSSSRTGVIAGS